MHCLHYFAFRYLTDLHLAFGDLSLKLISQLQVFLAFVLLIAHHICTQLLLLLHHLHFRPTSFNCHLNQQFKVIQLISFPDLSLLAKFVVASSFVIIFMPVFSPVKIEFSKQVKTKYHFLQHQIRFA